MKLITKDLKNKLKKLDSIEERLDTLRNKYKGHTAYLISCGPSLSSHKM